MSGRAAAKKSILSVQGLGFPFPTPDPFLFCVFHRDAYPAGDSEMRAPKRGNGADFDPSAKYRMYHGERIPGFPQHPHRGFETLTATMKGFTDHTDSLGNAGRYGEGDLQWLTAGSGLVHGENFPLIYEDRPNTLELFQIWLNLPAKSKMVEPAFVMHWNEEIPRLTGEGYTATVWAGELGGKIGLPPPSMSWASVPEAEVHVWLLALSPGGGEYSLPPAKGGKNINRALYFFDGETANVAGREFSNHARIDLDASQSVTVKNTHKESSAMFLVLGGRPIGEPVVSHGPFVMNTQQEIRQAFQDYRRTRFGGWPWDKDAVVFPRDKGRFALINGKEIRPPEETKKSAISIAQNPSKAASEL